jgi:hypothetical protein
MSVAHRGVIPHLHPFVQHLDTALAACDELLTQNVDAQSLLRLELTAITHLLQARQSAIETRMEDRDLRHWLTYFVAQTDELEVAGIGRSKVSRPANDRLLGGRVSLSSLTALLASLLDALDRRRTADDDDTEENSPQGSPVQSGDIAIWAMGADGV